MPPIAVLAHSIPPFPYDFRARATGRFSRPGAPDLLIDNTPAKVPRRAGWRILTASACPERWAEVSHVRVALAASPRWTAGPQGMPVGLAAVARGSTGRGDRRERTVNNSFCKAMSSGQSSVCPTRAR